MIISYSAAAQSALRRTVVYMIDGGSDAGTVSVYGGEIPASPDSPVGARPLLAKLKFKRNPRVGPDEAYGEFEEGIVGQSGRATWARIMNDGSAVFDCDVGELGSDAAIRLNTVELRKGGPLTFQLFGPKYL